MRKRPLKKESYYYSGSVALTANSTGQIIFQIASNFHFWFHSFSYKSSVNNANSIPTFDIQFLRNETQIFYDYINNEVFAGIMLELSTAPDTRYAVGLANWHRLPTPHFFDAKSNLIVNLRDTSGQANTVKIAIAGVKEVWYP